MRLPAYPLITIDPYMSIWSKSDLLYDSDTELWCGIKKRLTGTLTIDGKAYAFMGKTKLPVIKQTDLTVTPFTTKYVFENDKVKLTVFFWTPLILEDLHTLSLPCSFIDYSVEAVDGKEHSITVSLSAGEEFAYNKLPHISEKTAIEENEIAYAKIGRKHQNPLSKSGDAVAADWGFTCIYGGNCLYGSGRNAVTAKFDFFNVKNAAATHIIAFDDIYSIEYFGEKLKGLWTEKFSSVTDAILYCKNNRDELFEKLKKQESIFLEDAKQFGEDYTSILTAAARQVLAAHKLVRNSDGELLYLSKECNSNGCINTVDVSYPAVPLFLLYKPELVKAMLTGVFHFAHMPVWQAEYAPHDIGRYPLADGQVYALNNGVNKRTVYRQKKFSVYNPMWQMPVEECGNMLVMSYAYYCASKDAWQIRENYELLKKWANYLVKQGVILENQLCTDDFAGHSEKNVNLAIKCITGIACFAKISEALGMESSYMQTAKEYADKLSEYKTEAGFLPFSLDNNDSWSLKYNLVWDGIFGFELFDKGIYRAESEKYRKELNRYGVPLDYRKDFTKTDWLIWSSCLDGTKENVGLFSKSICRYLAETNVRHCFTDWCETKVPKECGFNHRSVQGGLWMPILKEKNIME